MRWIKILSIWWPLNDFPPFICLIYGVVPCWNLPFVLTSENQLSSSRSTYSRVGKCPHMSMRTSISYGQKKMIFSPALPLKWTLVALSKMAVDGKLPHLIVTGSDISMAFGMFFIWLLWLWWFFKSWVPLAALATLHHQDGWCLTRQSCIGILL